MIRAININPLSMIKEPKPSVTDMANEPSIVATIPPAGLASFCSSDAALTAFPGAITLIIRPAISNPKGISILGIVLGRPDVMDDLSRDTQAEPGSLAASVFIPLQRPFPEGLPALIGAAVVEPCHR